MSRSLKYDIPGTDWRIEPETLRERGLVAIFADDVAKPVPLVVEIGFGRGEFLLDLAQRAPETAHLGVEVSFKRTLKMARRLSRTEIRNVRLVESAAEPLLADGLGAGAVSCFWINFPDPWPKARHARRRFIQPPTARLLARCLSPEGVINVATDHPEYAEWIDEVLSAEAALVNRYAPERWRSEVPDRLPTAYELEWRALGRSFHFFQYGLSDLA